MRVVFDEMRLIKNHAIKRQFDTVAVKLVMKYPNSLKDKIDIIVIGSGHDSLMKQFISRNENLTEMEENSSAMLLRSELYI